MLEVVWGPPADSAGLPSLTRAIIESDIPQGLTNQALDSQTAAQPVVVDQDPGTWTHLSELLE